MNKGILGRLALALLLAAAAAFIFGAPSSAPLAGAAVTGQAVSGSWGAISATGPAGGGYLVKDAASSISTHLVSHSSLLPVLLFLASFLLFFVGTQGSDIRKAHASPIFACLLILLFPLYAAQVQAASTVQGVSISGADGFTLDSTSGFRRQTDIVTVRVDVSVDNDSQIDPGQVTFALDSTGVEKQGLCSGTTCEFIDLELTLPGDHHYLVRLKDDSGQLVAQQFMAMYSDSQPPKISLSKNQSIMGVGGQIAIDWHVRDVRDVQALCGVGIQEVRVHAQDFSGDILETIPGSGECELNGTYIAQSSGSGEGAFRLCFAAVDRFNKTQTSLSNCISYFEDNNPPLAEGIGVFTSDGSLPLTHMGPLNKSFMLQVNVTGNIVPSSVSFDLAAFGLGNVTPSHSQKNDSFHIFRYQGNADVDGSFAVSVLVSGNDEAGNPITPSTLSAGTIQWDSTGPKVTGYQSSFGSIDNILQIGRSGSLTATIEDTLLSPDRMRLIFAPAAGGSGYILPAKNCSQAGGSWECVWDFTDIHGAEGLYNITPDPHSSDLFGNLLCNESASAQAMVDLTPPVLIKYSLNVAHANDSIYGEEIVKGDKIQLFLYVNDSSQGLSAETNFTPIISTSGGISSAACEPDGTNISDFICRFPETGKIDNAFPFSLTVIITDAMGNNLTEFIPLPIIPFSNESNPDYWELVGVPECSPSMIDREITTLSSQKMYCRIDFQPRWPAVSLLSIAIADCQNSSSLAVSSFIQSFTQVNTDNTSSPWLKIQFKNVPMNISDLPMICPVRIYSKILGQDGQFVVVENAEVEEVPLTIKFYNNPLGDLDDNLEQKAQDAMEDAQGSLLEFVGTLEMIFELAENVCGLWNAWQNIVGAFNLATLITEKGENAVSVNPALAETLRQMKSETCMMSGEMQGKINKAIEEQKNSGFAQICGYVNCKYLPRGPLDENDDSMIAGRLDKWQIKGSDLLDSVYATTGNKNTFGQPAAGTLNIKENLILSLITGCIPGIIHGINKYRQTLCMYAYCMNSSAESGFDQSMCSDMKEYSMCMFVFGEIVYALPWTSLVSQWFDTLSEALSNPFAIIGSVASYVCKDYCPVPKAGGAMYWGCSSFHFLTMVSEAIAEIMGVFGPDELDSEVDWCEMIEEGEDGGFLGF